MKKKQNKKINMNDQKKDTKTFIPGLFCKRCAFWIKTGEENRGRCTAALPLWIDKPKLAIIMDGDTKAETCDCFDPCELCFYENDDEMVKELMKIPKKQKKGKM